MTASRLKAFKSSAALFLAGALFSTAAPAASPAASPSAGATAFDKACRSCHGGGMGGLMSGAPKAGSEAIKVRLQRAGSINALVTNTARGIGKMRAQGGPQGLSDAEIRAAVEWMLINEP